MKNNIIIAKEVLLNFFLILIISLSFVSADVIIRTVPETTIWVQGQEYRMDVYADSTAFDVTNQGVRSVEWDVVVPSYLTITHAEVPDPINLNSTNPLDFFYQILMLSGWNRVDNSISGGVLSDNVRIVDTTQNPAPKNRAGYLGSYWFIADNTYTGSSNFDLINVKFANSTNKLMPVNIENVPFTIVAPSIPTVAHYNFSSDFNDNSGNNNHGSAVGNVVLQGGQGINGAASFSGDNSHVTVADSSSLNVVDNLSLSLWMNAGAYNLSTIFILNKSDGTSGNDISWDVEFDSDGNIIVGSVSYTNSESIVRKIDRKGNLLWSKSVAGKGIYDIAIDSGGNIYGIGRINNFVVKYDSNGNLLWNNLLGTAIADGGGAGIATDSANNFVVTSHNSNGDLVVEKYDSNGNLIWSKTYSGAGFDHGYSVDVDNSDNVYVTGYTRSVLGGNSDVILLKYDSNGNLLWSRTFGGAKDDSANSVTTDNSGNIYVTGRTQSFTNSVASGLLLKYDSNGNLLWNKTFSPTDDVRGNSVVEKDGKVYVVGHGYSYSTWEDDLLFYTYGVAGDLLYYTRLGLNNKYETGEGIAVDVDGTVAIVGHSDSSTMAYENWILLYGKPLATLIDKGSYGIEYNGSSVIGHINNQKISAPINSGWQFVTLTYDNNEINLYISDGLVSSVSYNSAIAISILPLTMGTYYNGLLDEVKVFNRTLTLSDVQQLYNEGASNLGLIQQDRSLSSLTLEKNVKKAKKRR